MDISKSKLRIESSLNHSGQLLNSSKIKTLKEAHYYVKKYDLDGDAPKEFIKVYYIEDLASIENENKVVNLYVKNFKSYFINERNELILYLISERFKRVREL